MLDVQMEAAAVRYVKEIKNSDIYQRYCYQLEKIKKSPELYDKINEYRKKNYEMQSMTQVDELFDKMDAFEREYEKFRENPIVDDFLKAELAFCRLMQELETFVTQEIDFE